MPCAWSLLAMAVSSEIAIASPAQPATRPVFIAPGQPIILVDPPASIAAGSLKVRDRAIAVKPATFTIAANSQADGPPRPSPLDLWLFDTPRPWTLRPSKAGEAASVTLVTLPEGTSLDGSELTTFKLTDIDVGSAILQAAASKLPVMLRDAACSWWPTEAWRVDLLAEGTAASPRPGPADPSLVAWSASHRLAVASSIGRIASADADLAEQVARAILQTVALPLADGESVNVPFWADTVAIAALVGQVLPPGRSREQIRDAARAWLDQQPDALAWVTSDASLRDGVTGKRIATLGLLSLRARTLPSLRSVDPAARLTATFEALLPGIGQTTSITLRADGTLANTDPQRAAESAAAGVPIDLALGSRTQPITLALRPAPLRPPGITMAPALEDWTMPTLRAGAVRTSGSVSAVAVFDGQPRRLKVIFQSRRATRTDEQTITLFVGPPGGQARRIVVTSNGKVEGGTAVVAPGPELWSASIEIPDEAIEPDQSIRIGWTRTDSAGRRLAWPRPMLPAPWQTEPARIAIDLTAWDEGFGTQADDR